MKRRVLPAILAVGCMLFLFGGCYEPLPITDREMDLVAEYAAGVLVKYGVDSKEVLLNEREQKKLLEAEQASAVPTKKPTQELPKPTQGADDPSVTKTPDDDTTPSVTQAPIASGETTKELTRLFAKDGFSFQYTGFSETTLYQGAGEMFAAAEEGKKLIVVEFLVKNVSDSAKTLSMNKGASKDYSFSLRAGTKSFKPTLTLLREDFYTSYEMVYQPGESKKGVLVFECPENTDTSTMNLAILKENNGKDDSVIVKVN